MENDTHAEPLLNRRRFAAGLGLAGAAALGSGIAHGQDADDAGIQSRFLFDMVADLEAPPAYRQRARRGPSDFLRERRNG